MTYAEGTSVSTDRSATDIQRMLQRFGADHFGLQLGPDMAAVGFTYQGRSVRFVLPLPDRNDPKFALTRTGRMKRNADAAFVAWEQACRVQWRALHLFIKSLLVAIESRLIDFDRAFMHDIVMPNGKTVGQQLMGKVQSMLESGKRAPLMLEESSS